MAETTRSLMDYAPPPVSGTAAEIRTQAARRPKQSMSLLDFMSDLDLANILSGTGIPERFAAANEVLNPLAAIPRAQAASQEIFAPDRSIMQRIASTGNMLSEVGGVVVPMAASTRIGAPAATALMEGLLGGSPATQAASDAARRFLANESGSLPLPFKADDPAQAGGFLSDGNGSASIPLSTAEGSRRVSTRFPTGARSTEDPMTSQLSMNFNEALAGDVGAHNARLLSRYPGFARLSGMTPEEAARAYVDQSAGNLRYLIDRMPRGAIEETSQWYEGANRISDSLASRVGVPRQSMSANLAALSPQKDWFQNASLGERVADIVASQYDAPPTGEMMAYIFTNPKINTPRYTDELANMQGKAFRDMSDLQKAVYVRAFDEVYNPRNYRSVTPEGFLGDYVMTATGNPAKIAWGSFNEIGKAVRALESGGDMSIISPLLGERHKVRSFYNNIEDPYETFGEFGDVTGDTHAVAANQLRPLSGNTTAVAQNFGNSLDRKYQGPDWEPAKGSAVSGVQGTYGFNTEPYRQIAADYNVRPRGAQSVGWEAVRALFPDTFKTERNVNKIDDIWRAYDAGKISLDDARAAVFDAAQGFTGGNWGQPRSGLVRPEQGSTFR